MPECATKRQERLYRTHGNYLKGKETKSKVNYIDIEKILIERDWYSLLYSMAKGDITQYEELKLMDEEEFYHIAKNHQKRVEFEAKHPRVPFF